MKKLLIWLNIASVALILLGIIHLLATFAVIPMYRHLPKDQLNVFLFMYLGAGLATILPGLVSKMLHKLIKEEMRTAAWVVFICAVTALLLGLGAVITMPQNVFAYVSLVLGISLLIPSVLLMRRI
jgi:hypothetical protein